MPGWIWELDNWPLFTWDADAVLEGEDRVRRQLAARVSRVETLDDTLSREARLAALVSEALETSAIEGEILDRDSVRSSAARHLGLDTTGLPVPGPRETGLVEIIWDALDAPDEPLTLRRLCRWHSRLFPAPADGSLGALPVGELRGDGPMRVLSGPLGSERVHFAAPDRGRLEPMISEFIEAFEENADGTSGLVRAGIAHLWFLTLHPFEDGNGRLARAITELALARDGPAVRLYSMSAEIMNRRADYYRILERTQRGDLDITAWLHWFLDCLAGAIDRSEETLTLVVAKARFWRKHASTILTARQIKILNRLLDVSAGRFEGGMSTRKYARMTSCSRATASRELTDLVDKGCLQPRPGGGRSTSYDVAVPEVPDSRARSRSR